MIDERPRRAQNQRRRRDDQSCGGEVDVFWFFCK